MQAPPNIPVVVLRMWRYGSAAFCLAAAAIALLSFARGKGSDNESL